MEMGKNITIPEDYNVSKNLCGTLTQISGNTYNGTDIKITDVKSALGEINSNLGFLCTSSKINKWAAFKPGVWVTNTDFLNGEFSFVSPSDGYRLGDFIGYNHNAKPPVYYYNTIPNSISVERWNSINLNIQLARGEAEPVYKQIFAMGSKNEIDVKYAYSSDNYRNNLVSVPSTGYVSKNIDLRPTISGTLIITPTYYVDEIENLNYLSCIEGGKKEIQISVTPIKFSGTIQDYPDQTGNYFYLNFDWSVTRTDNSPKEIYLRIYASGTGVQQNYTNLGYKSFSPNETKSGTASVYFVSPTSTPANVLVHLEAGNDSSFTNTSTISTSVFYCDFAGGA